MLRRRTFGDATRIAVQERLLPIGSASIGGLAGSVSFCLGARLWGVGIGVIVVVGIAWALTRLFPTPLGPWRMVVISVCSCVLTWPIVWGVVVVMLQPLISGQMGET